MSSFNIIILFQEKVLDLRRLDIFIYNVTIGNICPAVNVKSLYMTHHYTLVLVVVITHFTPVGHSVQELQSLDGFHKIFQGLRFVAVVFGVDIFSDGLEEYSVLCTVDS